MSIDRRILIADDDAEVRAGAVELMLEMGLEVLEAGSGSEALTIVRRTAPLHLAVLDMNMPGHSGLEVFETLRRETLDLPCILWSGDATDVMEQVVLRAGASAFLRKPVRPDELRANVRQILEARWGASN